ncbi:SpoVG family protein [Thalassoroseus pseudoceratinae]|uniref:SpoVG family protein n=1 Tax=Thalassoroseus pseudoceratinae TaxID=2713176 RepID=UPI00141F547B|nr:SpoVG family protein [Thalassoroseus pseudoceratinae]
MEITEVRIKLMDDPNDRLQAFCSITFDSCFVIRDLKIIQGSKGSFVAMPSRKLTDRCPRCQCKNHLRSQYCNHCGLKLDEERATRNTEGRAKLYADIAHPINSACRELIQERVLTAFEEELELSKSPDYICTYDDYGEESYEDYEYESDTSEDFRPTTPTRTFQDDRDVRHRIEPAQTTPNAPHRGGPRFGNSSSNGHEKTAVSGNYLDTVSNDDGLGFGEGVL